MWKCGTLGGFGRRYNQTTVGTWCNTGFGHWGYRKNMSVPGALRYSVEVLLIGNTLELV